MKKLTILVTGGLGSIGHVLCKRLIKEGHSVVIVDDLSVGHKEFLEDMPRAKLYECSVSDYKSLKKAFKENNIDAVYHLAARHYIPYCETHPKETMETNVFGTLNIITLMKEHKVPRLIFASTSSVYEPRERPYKEDDKFGTVNIYGVSKLVCEHAIQNYGPHYDITYTIARFFNVYGTDDLVHHVIPELVQQAQNSDVIKVGNLHAKRDFIHVDDIVDAIVKCLENEKARNNIYNIGTGRAISIQDVVDAICKAAGKKFKIEVDEKRKRKVDPPVLLADNSKIIKDLDWHPDKGFSLEKIYAETKFWPVDPRS